MDKLDIVTDESGNEVVLLPEIIFSNKQNINWNDVEDYLGKYVGELITSLDKGTQPFVVCDG